MLQWRNGNVKMASGALNWERFNSVGHMQVANAHGLELLPIAYHTNVDVLRNTNFCVGLFEFYLRQIVSTAPRIGGNYSFLLRSVCAEFSFTELFLFDGFQKICFAFCLFFFLGFWFIHFGATEKDLGYVRRWDTGIQMWIRYTPAESQSSTANPCLLPLTLATPPPPPCPHPTCCATVHCYAGTPRGGGDSTCNVPGRNGYMLQCCNPAYLALASPAPPPPPPPRQPTSEVVLGGKMKFLLPSARHLEERLESVS